MKENIEYKKGWQIEKNGSPNSLHFKFSDDKIYHGINSSLNLGLAEMESIEVNKGKLEESFKRVLNEWQPADKDFELIKDSFLRKRDFWEQEPELANAVARKIIGFKLFDTDDDELNII